MSYEYHAHAIGARSQSARTYLEQHHAEFADASLEDLIQHGLNALRDTLQQDKTLTAANTSLGIIGPPPASALPEGVAPTSALVVKKSNFRTIDDAAVEPYLEEMRRRNPAPAPAEEAVPAAAGAGEGGDGGASGAADGAAPIVVDQPEAGAAPTGGNAPAAGDGDGDVQMQ